MNINYCRFHLLDFSDEILLKIFNQLNGTDLLYSLIGVNQRLDRLAQENSYTKSIDLVKILSRTRKVWKKRAIIDRFSLEILPRIRSHIQHLTLDSLSIDQILSVGYYSKLSHLVLVNLQSHILLRLFNDLSLNFEQSSSFIQIYKHQILHLIVTIDRDLTDCDELDLISRNSFVSLLNAFPNLEYLQFTLDDIFLHETEIHWYSPLILNDFPSITKCQSLNLNYLNVQLANFDDCLDLLDGRIDQLQTLIVQIYSIDSWKSIPLNKVNIYLCRIQTGQLLFLVVSLESDIKSKIFLVNCTSDNRSI